MSAELRAGRSVCLNKCETPVTYAGVTGFEGIGTKTKAIVPIFVAGEFIGVVGFDNTRQRRAIDPRSLPRSRTRRASSARPSIGNASSTT